METELVKENVRVSAPLGARWLAAAAAATALALAAVARLDSALPPPRDRSAPNDSFIAEIALEHLVNLTSMGPRVAGSYENEVLAVAVVSEALRGVARAASRHNRLDVDLHSSAGAFPLTFLDGMNNVYYGVQSVVARLSGAGSTHGPALLINCHFDSVPDSPGASDDAAGCAVGLEVLRALAAAERPLRRDVLLLLNGAEENIMQASHSFITTHRWARQVRAFINIEACGAGGREVLFQAGPHDPWIMEVYAGAVPRPFASSLAQELFESGLIPGDTDFRVFRDFGNLSGVDLAWSANGYVYHTRLDAWQSVPAAALQRTGDNVLALARGLVEHPAMDARAELAPQPVFFDVLGLGVVCARGHAAAAAAAATLALVALRVHLNARDASKQLYMVAGAWWALALRGLVAGAAGAGGGLAAAGAAAALLHAAGRSLPYYTSTWLLVPLYALPALCCGCWCTAAGWRRAAAGAPLVRGWWAARLAADALALGWALLLGGAAAARLRSGYVPLLPALLPTAADLAASLAGLSPGARAACWAGGWALPVLQLWYLTLACLAMFVPLAGRAGSPPAPADVAVALLAAALTMAPASWLMPLYLVTRGRHRLMCGLALWSAAVLALVLLGALGEPYSAARPQRLMLFHTRRTDHAANTTDTLYWAPHIDANTRQSLDKYVSPLVGGAPAVEMSAAECARHVYCGAPYFLPARGLIRRGYWLPAPGDAPLARLHAGVALQRHNRTHHTVTIHVTDGGAHVMVLVSPTGGGEVARYWAAGAGGGPPVQALRWGARRTYCCMLHQRQPAAYSLQLDLVHKEGAPAEGVAALSVAAHAMFGARMRTPAHAALLARLPPAVAATGWGVDLHLYHV